MINKSIEKRNNSKIIFENKIFDAAVSRAYYAVFHIISAVLFTKGISIFNNNRTNIKNNLIINNKYGIFIYSNDVISNNNSIINNNITRMSNY